MWDATRGTLASLEEAAQSLFPAANAGAQPGPDMGSGPQPNASGDDVVDAEFTEVADVIALALQSNPDVAALRSRVTALTEAFPLYPGLQQ